MAINRLWGGFDVALGGFAASNIEVKAALAAVAGNGLGKAFGCILASRNTKLLKQMPAALHQLDPETAILETDVTDECGHLLRRRLDRAITALDAKLHLRRSLAAYRAVCLIVLPLLLACRGTHAADWVRAGLNTNQPLWGVRGGLLWAIPPGGFRPAGGPRGLIRVGYPTATNGSYNLINFIAVEPIVHGQRGFSELEPSALDHTRGKRLWAVGETNLALSTAQPSLIPGRLWRPSAAVEQLDVTVRVEPFDNGARVRLLVSQRTDTPDEIQLAVHTEPGSAPLDYCILTATMGNLARTRLLWLKDAVVSSLQLYPQHRGEGFAPPQVYPLDRLARTAQGGVVVAVTTDEADPASVYPFPDRQLWHYGGFKVTQYWMKPRGQARADLHVAVNARYTYWQTSRPIPGGVAFENFELREHFYEGQVFTFGLTRKAPAQPGIPR